MATHEALLFNFVYEFDSYCTSIIARLSNGTIIHERLLDFNFPNETRVLTYLAKYYRGDEYLFDALMFAGDTNVFTGYKEGAFSITLNQRKPDGSSTDLAVNLGLIFSGYNQVAWTIRETLTNCTDYACALEKLQTDHMVAPAYFILAGTKNNEGAIISRDRFGTAHLDELSDDRWYLV
jgi:hypothetical protein